jgi:hypothetical protein
MRSGSLITCCSSFSFKTLFRYPLRYIIQIFTKSDIEHVAIYFDNKIAECLFKDGIRIIFLSDWLEEHKSNKMKIYENSFNFDLTESQIEKIDSFVKKKFGEDYSIGEAILSILPDEIEYEDDNKTYCSEFVKECYLEAGILSPSFKKKNLNPGELLNTIKKLNLLGVKNRIK